MNKKYVILFFVTVIAIASFITIKLPPKKEPITLEEVKEKILLTKRIAVEKHLIPNDEIITYPDIKDEENIKKIVELLSNMYSPPSGWDSRTGHDTYYFKLFDETDDLMATVEVYDSLPWRIEGDEYYFSIDSDSENEKALKELLESEYDIILS